MFRTARIKFKGSENPTVSRCFTVGKEYHSDISSAGNHFIYDDAGETWAIDPDDDDFAVME